MVPIGLFKLIVLKASGGAAGHGRQERQGAQNEQKKADGPRYHVSARRNGALCCIRQLYLRLYTKYLVRQYDCVHVRVYSILTAGVHISELIHTKFRPERSQPRCRFSRADIEVRRTSLRARMHINIMRWI